MNASRGRRSLPASVVATASAAALLAGCTICPSPYDYAGPVPNGSAPQFDWRARSGGILPLGAAPRPWPSLVQGAEADAPVVAEEPVAEDPAVTRTAAVDPTATLAATATPGADPALDADFTPGTETAAAVDEAAPAPVTAAPDAIPVLAETPGWRPRRATDPPDDGG